MKVKESDIKRTVEDYLQIKMNQGELYFDRLNSGEIIVEHGGKRYKIKLCREGTADFYVLKSSYVGAYSKQIQFPHCMIIYLETKAPKGKQSEEQKEFQALVEAQGASYFIVRSIDELMEIV